MTTTFCWLLQLCELLSGLKCTYCLCNLLSVFKNNAVPPCQLGPDLCERSCVRKRHERPHLEPSPFTWKLHLSSGPFPWSLSYDARWAWTCPGILLGQTLPCWLDFLAWPRNCLLLQYCLAITGLLADPCYCWTAQGAFSGPALLFCSDTMLVKILFLPASLADLSPGSPFFMKQCAFAVSGNSESRVAP